MCDDYRAATRLRTMQLDTARRKVDAARKRIDDATNLAEIERHQTLAEMWQAQVDRYEAEERRKTDEVGAGMCTEDEWELLYAMRTRLATRDPFEVSREALVAAAENLALVEAWARGVDESKVGFRAAVQAMRDAAADDVVALATQLTITAGKKK